MKKKTAPKRVSRSSKSSKPALTSPWKIGMFVSLLLVLVSIGVGYYFVDIHGVNLAWISIRPEVGWRGLKIDSLAFFREMYPLVTAIVLVSLIAYFLVASAVRRYRSYLNSGQDYRKMISLAESVDDLTNPAQIARLSSYPELQAVLRSYGDQIREISQDINVRQASTCCDDIETDVETLLRDGEVPSQVLGTKPYASALRCIQERLSADRTQIGELADRCDAQRRELGRAALTYGRVIEEASGAGEELMEISKMAGDLGRFANEIVKQAPEAASAVDATQQPSEAAASVESAARKLEDGSRLLQELSDENNGIAISLALMAARASIDEHELAAYAERVRMAAERFHKLSLTVSAIAKDLVGASYALKEQPAGAISAGGPEANGNLHRAIKQIAARFEDQSSKLQERICILVSELQDVNEIFRRDTVSSPAAPAEPRENVEPPDETSRDESAVDDQSAAVSSFRVDHGSVWNGMPESAETPDAPSAGSATEESASPSEALQSPAPDPHAGLGDFSDMSSLRNLDGENAPPETNSAPEPAGRGDDAWLEMPGHRWLKVQVDKGESEGARDVPVTVERPSPEPAGACGDAGDAASREDRAPCAKAETEYVIEPERAGAPAADDEENDPVHDLFELGAVEYAAEVEAKM